MQDKNATPHIRHSGPELTKRAHELLDELGPPEAASLASLLLMLLTHAMGNTGYSGVVRPNGAPFVFFIDARFELINDPSDEEGRG